MNADGTPSRDTPDRAPPSRATPDRGHPNRNTHSQSTSVELLMLMPRIGDEQRRKGSHLS